MVAADRAVVPDRPRRPAAITGRTAGAPAPVARPGDPRMGRQRRHRRRTIATGVTAESVLLDANSPEVAAGMLFRGDGGGRLLAGPAVVGLAGRAALDHRPEDDRLGQLVAGQCTGGVLDERRSSSTPPVH